MHPNIPLVIGLTTDKPSCKRIKQSELARFELNGGLDLK